MLQLSELLERLGSEYTHGYGPSPIPSGIDAEVDDVITSFIKMDERGRNEILSQMKEAHGFVFVAFAERMASCAVRERRSHLIERGLSALAIAVNLVYYKETLPAVSLLYHSASQLGLGTREFLASSDFLRNDVLNGFITDFLDRTEEDRGIEAMGYVEDEDRDGFRYRRTW